MTSCTHWIAQSYRRQNKWGPQSTNSWAQVRTASMHVRPHSALSQLYHLKTCCSTPVCCCCCGVVVSSRVIFQLFFFSPHVSTCLLSPDLWPVVLFPLQTRAAPSSPPWWTITWSPRHLRPSSSCPPSGRLITRLASSHPVSPSPWTLFFFFFKPVFWKHVALRPSWRNWTSLWTDRWPDWLP